MNIVTLLIKVAALTQEMTISITVAGHEVCDGGWETS